MVTGTFTDLTNIRGGLEILQGYNPQAVVVVRQYIAHVPEILITAISAPHQADLLALGWKAHPIEGGMFYSLTYV